MSEMSDQSMRMEGLADWVVYMIRADDQRLYTGITNDIARRWRQHCEGGGAKFFRGRKPEALVFLELGHDRPSALRREAAIKKLSRAAKLVMIAAAGDKSAVELTLISQAKKQTADAQ